MTRWNSQARREFLRALGIAGIAPGLLAARAGDSAPDEAPYARVLVLSGGGARGAYEAGAIGALAAIAGVRDGQPLLPYEAVCGTSIGALNGWFLATGQYAKLKELWYGIGAERLMRLKPEFSALEDSQSGAFNRVASAVRLISLASNQSALLQSDPVLEWIARNVDPDRPLVMPLAWAVTNLTTQRPEYFYLVPPGSRESLSQTVVDSLRATLGPHTVVRKVSTDLLHRALFASAAIPLAFDPVELPDERGEPNAYVDGGVASNSAVAVAHAVSRAADVILLDPPYQPTQEYTDAIAIALGSFGTMQRKILEVEMRDVYFQSTAKRAFARLGASRGPGADGPLARFLASVPATDLAYMRPKDTLPLGIADFHDEAGIGKAYRIGWSDAAGGFMPYTWETFEL